MENGELDFTGVALLEELLVLHWTTAAVHMLRGLSIEWSSNNSATSAVNDLGGQASTDALQRSCGAGWSVPWRSYGHVTYCYRSFFAAVIFIAIVSPPCDRRSHRLRPVLRTTARFCSSHEIHKTNRRCTVYLAHRLTAKLRFTIKEVTRKVQFVRQ